jgi:hypothetical protein
MAEKDPNQMAAEKLDRETKKVQAEQAAKLEEASEKVRQGKIQPPTNDDMGPLPKKNSKGAGIIKSYKKGGMVKSSASKRADGIATKGKTRGKIC